MPNEITKELLHELLDYNPNTGYLIWKVHRGGTARKGTRAGALDHEGYRLVSLYNKTYKAHRLIWLYVTGNWPEGVIDHLDHDKDNNKLDNLRDCSHSHNSHNTSSKGKGKSKYLGVYIDSKSGRPTASIRIGGKTKYLGSFDSEEEAHAAYLSVKRLLLPEKSLQLHGLVN